MNSAHDQPHCQFKDILYVYTVPISHLQGILQHGCIIGMSLYTSCAWHDTHTGLENVKTSQL